MLEIRTLEPAVRLYTSEGFQKSSKEQGTLHMVLEVEESIP